MDTNLFNQILVIDSIPSGDSNTAKRLFEDIKTLSIGYSPTPAVHYLRVESGDQFIQCIFKCREDAALQNIIPMLHIECHGNEDGFQFADGSFAYWEELKLPITELNVATRLNLLITVAACAGGALAKVLRVSDRAPFWGLIGPTRTLIAGELEKAYRALYLTLLSTKSSAKAVETMDAATEPGMFLRRTSQDLFKKAWSLYKKEYCSTEALEVRAKRMQNTLEQLPGKLRPTTAEFTNLLVNHEPKAFERFRSTFFMYDLFPEHVSRFPIKYFA